MTHSTPRVLLTGGSGYIGLHLVRELLQAGYSVTAAVRQPNRISSFVQHSNLQVVVADFESMSSFETLVAGHDCCIHGAFIWGEPGSDLEIKDTSVTAKLFDACGKAGVKRCIFLSSAAVHRPFAGEMREDDSIHTADYYGATKAASEVFMRAACAMHGLLGIVIRPGLVVGPPAFAGGAFRSDRRVAAMVAEAISNVPITVPDEPGRQFINVADLARIVLHLIELDSPRDTYLCLDRDIIEWETVAEMVGRESAATNSVLRPPCRSEKNQPRFHADRVIELEGKPLDAREALQAHIRCLIRNSKTAPSRVPSQKQF
jgi:nucleoside-diphosphate-sugar epimerase